MPTPWDPSPIWTMYPDLHILSDLLGGYNLAYLNGVRSGLRPLNLKFKLLCAYRLGRKMEELFTPEERPVGSQTT